MPTFKKFTGINNVLPLERLGTSELSMASNVDIGMDSEVRRRTGFALTASGAYSNVWEADGFVLAVKGDDLVNALTGDVLQSGVGTDRMWYCNLADGRTAYSNGTYNGVVTAAARTGWGVPVPATLGTPADVTGALFAGDYQYSLTYVRTSDGLEGGPAYAPPFAIAAGGLSLTDLPAAVGYSINVYLTSHFGGQGYLAGNTAGTTFAFDGENKDLVLPCRTDFMQPAPLGTFPCLWNGRILLAVGKTLYASLPAGRVEMFDMRRDFKQFSADITGIVHVDDGVYVGTTKELAFLSGPTFDKLSYTQVVDGGVVKGSMVGVDGEHVRSKDGDASSGQAIICIADNMLVAGLNGGQVLRMTEGRYATTVNEVSAAFRIVNNIPQYIAIPQ